MPAMKLTAPIAAHQHPEAGAVERAVRREHRGKESARVPAIVGGHGAQYTVIHGEKSRHAKARRARRRKTQGKARKAAARRKPARKRPAADVTGRTRASSAWTPAEVEEAFRRFKAASPEPQDRTAIRQSVHAAGRGGAVGAGDRRRRQQGDARAVRRSPTRRRRWPRSARRACAT